MLAADFGSVLHRRMQVHMQKMEVARVRRTFEAIDEDGSGELEREEFHTCYLLLAQGQRGSNLLLVCNLQVRLSERSFTGWCED